MRNKTIFTLMVIAFLGIVISKGETILFIGDSITDGNWGSPQGYPCSSEQRNLWDKNHVLGHGYVEMTAGYYMGTFPEKDYEFYNRGISGETLFNIASRWDKDVMENHPSNVSLLCGTNDVHYWLESNPDSLSEFDFNGYKSTLDSLVKYTKSILPDCKFILCTPFVAKAGKVGSSDQFELRRQAVDSISRITKEVAIDNNLMLVDFNKLADKLSQERKDMEYWIWDGIHPTTAMHHRMSKEWIDKVGEL